MRTNDTRIVLNCDGSKLHTVTVSDSLEVSLFTVGNRLFYRLKGADTFTVTELTD